MNQLVTLVQESGLEESKSRYILENFQDYFKIAEEWELKARTLVVTNPDQTAEMEMARVGRLFLREKRIAIEKSRKELKEQSLREGKAIDGIANVLKALIVPIEEYLDKQEHFVQIEQKKKDDIFRAEIEKRMEEERLQIEFAAQIARDTEDRRVRAENEELKRLAQINADKQKAEKLKHDAEMALERKTREVATALAEKKRKAELEVVQAENARIQAERDKKEAEERQIRADTEKLRKAKHDAEMAEKAKLEEMLKNQIVCPNCNHKFQLERK